MDSRAGENVMKTDDQLNEMPGNGGLKKEEKRLPRDRRNRRQRQRLKRRLYGKLPVTNEVGGRPGKRGGEIVDLTAAMAFDKKLRW
jgi:hypothetical protein